MVTFWLGTGRFRIYLNSPMHSQYAYCCSMSKHYNTVLVCTIFRCCLSVFCVNREGFPVKQALGNRQATSKYGMEKNGQHIFY